ncbi:MAG TPA: hypothetical protein VKR53_21555 [Puia sp.]|nr:hypothetical protein [Puia sp.]
MGETVMIPVNYRGEERSFEAELQVWQYGYRFIVPVDGMELVFERDDSGDYRAIASEVSGGELPDRELVQAIAEVLQTL